ncbi:MAG: hypothetical protein ACREVL_14475 [Solimonas sp.]
MNVPRFLWLIPDASPMARAALAGLALLAGGSAYGGDVAMPSHEALVGQALAAARDLPPADESGIDTVIVRPDALAESDRRLAKLVSSLPGAADPLSLDLDLVDLTAQYFARRADPNELSDDQKQVILKSFESGSNKP